MCFRSDSTVTRIMNAKRKLAILIFVISMAIANNYWSRIFRMLNDLKSGTLPVPGTGHYLPVQNERITYNCSCINRTIPAFPSITANRSTAIEKFGIPKEFFDASLRHEVHDSYGISKQPSGLCTQGNAVDYLLLVLGAVKNFDLRMSIRETYGNISRIENRTLDLVFVIGKEEGIGEYAAAVQNESRTYKDILEIDFIDSYQNLTIKTILALRWVLTDCPQAKFVVRNMDDCFLDVFKLDKEMRKIRDFDIFLGCAIHGSHINHDGKWPFTSEVPFVNDPKIYAPYISGISIVFSVDVVKKFYYLSCFVPLVWPDDCYLGYLALLIDITPYHHVQFCYEVIRHMFLSSNTAKMMRDEWQKRYN